MVRLRQGLAAMALLAAVQASEGNLVSNGSFELGTHDWSLCESAVPVDDALFKVEGQGAALGKRCLLLRSAQGTALGACSRLFEVEPGQRYMVSANLRGDGRGKATLVLGYAGQPVPEATRRTFEVGPEWQRQSLNIAKMPSCTNNVAWVEIWAESGATDRVGPLWIDGVQAEAGTLTEYRPSDNIAFAVTSAVPGNVFALADPVVLEVRVENAGSGAVNCSAHYEVLDYFDRRVASGRFNLSVPASSVAEHRMPLALKRPGYYEARFEFSLPNGKQLRREVSLARILKQDTQHIADSSPFGIHGGPSGYQLELGKWIGIKHWRARPYYEWGYGGAFDPINRTLDVGRRNGLRFLVDAGTFPGYSGKAETADAELARVAEQWAKGWGNLAGCDPAVLNAFEIWNEVYAFPYAPAPVYLKAQWLAHRAIKAANPRALVVANVMMEWSTLSYLDEFLRGGGLTTCDAISLHPYMFTVSPEAGGLGELMDAVHQHLRRLGGRDLPLWITEMNWVADKDYERKWYPFSGAWDKSSMTPERTCSDWSARSFLIALERGLQRYYYHMYGGSMAVYHPWCINRRDYTPKPFYVAYGTLSRLLVGTRPAGRYGRLTEPVRACAFQTKGRGLLAYWHALPDLREQGWVTLRLPRDVEVLDLMGAAVSSERHNSNTRLPITGSPRFVVSNKVGGEALLAAFAAAKVEGLGQEKLLPAWQPPVETPGPDPQAAPFQVAAFQTDGHTRLLLHLDGDVVDSGPNQWPVRLVGAPVTWESKGLIGGCLRVETTAHLSLPLQVWPHDQGTLEAWARVDRWAPNQNVVLDGSRLELGGLFFVATPAGWYCYSRAMASAIRLGVPEPKLGRWYHAALCWDREALRVFVDGKCGYAMATKVEDFEMLPRMEKWLLLGSAGPHGWDLYNLYGALDEVRISDVVRYPREFSLQR